MAAQHQTRSGEGKLSFARLAAISILVTVVAAAVMYYAAYAFFVNQAKEKIQNILLSHRGVHLYIQRVMLPEFYRARNNGDIFRGYYSPEIFSSTFMVRVLHGFYNEERKKAGLHEIYYKMAADNPRNPVNKANPFESGLIRMFNKKRDVREYQSIISINGKKYLYYAIPFLTTNNACLQCHGIRENSPPGLRMRYPGKGGFGDKEGNIRAIESIRVPIEHEIYTADVITASLSAGLITMLLLGMFNSKLRMLVRSKTVNLESEVTERKQAERSLQLFRNLIEQSNDAIFVAEAETSRILDVNARACSSLGYTARELLSMITTDIEAILPDHPSWKAHTDEVKNRENIVLEGRHKRKDGSSFPVEVSVKYVTMDRKNYIVAVARDLTERKKLEEQLLQAQKMEAVGHLAGGIAHDFNNMLTTIIGYGSLLNTKIERHSPLKPFVDQILSSAEKSANLTRQLLAFSRKQIISPRHTDLNELIRGIEKFLRNIIGEDIEFNIALTDKELTAMVDPGQIEQVLMNLCTNARDAMPNGGLLSITTGRVTFDEHYAMTHDLKKPGKYALISVTDSGMGIDERIVQNIFEPFFTTKELGKGTGLGLSIVYGIVKQHNGHVNVYSEQGKGATFKIYLPLIESRAEKAEAEDSVPPKGGTELILVVEDNVEVKDLTKFVLEDSGYKVIEAADGEDAVQKFEENKDAVRLVLLDVIIPKKSGKEVYDEIRKMRPDVAVLFTSGYTADVIHKKGMLDTDIDFISKPVTPNELITKIREILDRRKG